MIYTIPYILLIIFLGIIGIYYDQVKNDIQKKYLVIAVVVVFFIFFAFRGFILSDWISYYPFFYDCKLSDILDYRIGEETTFEPGYTLLNVLCKSIFHEYFFFQFVVASIDTALLLRFFKKTVRNIPFVLMIYITFEGLVISTNLMRNSIAILLFLNALIYIEKRKPVHYFSICLLALSFHFSALIFFPLYFFFHKRYNKWTYLSIFITCNIIYLGHFSLFLTTAKILGIDEQFAMRIKSYTETYNAATALSIGYMERLFTGCLIFLYYEKLNEIRKNNAIFINGLIAYFIMFFFFSEFAVLSKRFATLFAYGYWIIWMDLIRCFYYDNNRRLFKTFIILYCAMRMAGSTYLPDFDYDNILFGHKSYQERLFIHNRTFELQ